MDKIIEEEESRVIPQSKKDASYPDYRTFHKWLDELDIDSCFINESNWKTMMTKGKKLQKTVVEKTLNKFDKSVKLRNVLEEVTRYLGEEDKLKRADAVIVFGSQDVGRIEKAVKLKKEGLVEKIVVSGKGRFDSGRGESESFVFKKRALDLGVPEQDIVVDDTSLTIGSNVRHSLNRLDDVEIKYRSIMTMVVWFAQRRAWCHLMKYTEGINIIRVNSDIPKDRPLSTKNWYRNEQGINIVYGEFLKMRMAVILDTA